VPGWLLLHDRLQCSSNLIKKNIVDEDICVVCRGYSEIGIHLFRDCSFAKEYWGLLGWSTADMPDAAHLWEIKRPVHVPQHLFSTLILLCCCHLWKHRNAVVFRKKQPSLARLMIACKEDCEL